MLDSMTRESLLGYEMPQYRSRHPSPSSYSDSTRNTTESGLRLGSARGEDCVKPQIKPQPESDLEYVIPRDGSNSDLLARTNPVSRDAPGKTGEDDKSPAWRPFWLQRVIFNLFFTLFLCFTIVLPLLRLYSKRNDGLVESLPRLTYAWRFIPTAILTLIQLIWSRVEFQALRYMPWIAMKSGEPLDQSLYNLDYTTMLPPMVLIHSFQRRHYLLFLISMVSIILKVQIVLSASLFQLESIWTLQSVPVEVLDTFNTATDPYDKNDNSTQVSEESDMAVFAYYNARAIEHFDVELPFGVADQAAYQTFKIAEPGNRSRGTVNEPLTVTVDAAFMEMNCLEVENYNASAIREWEEDGQDTIQYKVELQFENCDQTVTIKNEVLATQGKGYEYAQLWDLYTDLETKHPCSILPKQNPSFVYFGGLYGPSSKNWSLPRLDYCQALLCSPTAWVSKVEILDNGINPKLNILPNEDKVPIKSNPFTMLQESMPIDGQWSTTYWNESNLSLNGIVKSAYLSTPDNETLLNAFNDLTTKNNPMLSHYLLRQTGDTKTIQGSIKVSPYKIRINALACYLLTGLFAIMTGLTFWIALFEKTPYIWHRDPASIFGSLLFFHDNSELSRKITGSMKDGKNKNRTEWADSSYLPIVLQLWARSIFTFLVLGIIIGLIITLNKSERMGGLVIGPKEDSYWPLLWTSLPASIMLVVSLYIGSNDFAIRSLAMFLNLSTKPCKSQHLEISLINMLGLHALYHSIRLKILAVSLAQILVIVCAFLTSLSAMLFTIQSVPQVTETSLKQDSWFGSQKLPRDPEESQGDRETRMDLSSLLLTKGKSDFKWPRNTYGDLTFPILETNNIEWNTNISVDVVTPAVKVASSCIQLSDKDFNISIGTTEGYPELNITQYFTCLNGTDNSLQDTIYVNDETNVSYMANVISSQSNLSSLSGPVDCNPDPDNEANLYVPWGVETYLWGQFSVSNESLDHLAIWRCNYSWAEVMTDVRLVWNNGSVQIDQQNPPTERKSTIKPWSPPFRFPLDILQLYSYAFPNIRLNASLFNEAWGPFVLLIEPFGPFQAEDLGKPEKDEKIIEQLNSNIGIIGAQLANVEHRLRLDETSAMKPARHEDLSLVKATVTNPKNALVQNANVTFAIIAILLLVLIVNVWSLTSTLLQRVLGHKPRWLLDTDFEGVAPESFNSITSMKSLVHRSNAMRDLPADAYLIPPNELHKWLSEKSFRLAWFQEPQGEKRYTIGASNDESFVFLGNNRPGKKGQKHEKIAADREDGASRVLLDNDSVN